MTVTEEIAALQELHSQQGYLLIGSINPLPTGPIDLKVWSTDEAYRAARWTVLEQSTREEFEQQAMLAFGRESGYRVAQYFYRVVALD